MHKAIWGGKAKAYLVGQMAVVPYMELFDRSEVFLLSQGVFEKITNDDFSREKLNEVTQRMWALGLRWG